MVLASMADKKKQKTITTDVITPGIPNDRLNAITDTPSIERQKGLTTSHINIQFDNFASKLLTSTYLVQPLSPW